MPRRVYHNWITIRGVSLPGNVKAGILNCDRCGQDMQIQFPIELNNLLALAGTFGNIHNQCEEMESEEAE